MIKPTCVFLFLVFGALCVSSQAPKLKLPVYISITRWVGDIFISKDNTIHMLVPRNSSFYDVMKRAAKINPKYFDFEEIEDEAHGRLITSIGGLKQDEATSHYWMIYKLNTKPNHLHPPRDEQLSPVGVDQILVNKGDHFLWWYKKVYNH